MDGSEVARTDAGSKALTDQVQCEAGKPLALEMEFIKPGTNPQPPDDVNRLRLRWRRGDTEWQTVPSAWLRHSRQQEFELERILR